jgi:hypothetical protein
MKFLYLVQNYSRNKTFCNRFRNIPGNIRIFIFGAQTLPKSLYPTKNIKTEIFMPHEASPLDACLPSCLPACLPACLPRLYSYKTSNFLCRQQKSGEIPTFIEICRDKLI